MGITLGITWGHKWGIGKQYVDMYKGMVMLHVYNTLNITNY